MIWILLLTLLAWAYCFFCGHVSDDNDKFERMPKQKLKDVFIATEQIAADKFKRYPNTSVVHDLINFIFWKVFGKKHWGWFLFSISVHLLNTYLVYKTASIFFSEDVSLVAALIFGVHSANHQGVAWISGAGYSLCGMFCMLSIIYGQNYFIFFIIWGLALSSFLGASTLPVVMAIWYQDPNYLWFMLLGLAFLVFKFKTRFKLLQARSRYFMPYLSRINMLINVLVYYFFLGTTPVKMGWYHEVGFDYNPKMDRTNTRSILGLIALICIFIGANYLGLTPYLMWFVLFLLPSMNIIFCNSFVAERYIYVPLIGLSMCLSVIAFYLPYTGYLVSAYVGFLLVHTVQVCRSYRSNLDLYKYNVWKHPGSTYAINNLGFFYLAKQRPDIAINYFREAIKLEPNNKFAWHSLGTCLAFINTEVSTSCPKCGENFKTIDSGNFWKALMGMNRSVELSPNWDIPQKNIKEVVEHMKRCGLLVEQKTEGQHGQSHTSFSPPAFKSQHPDTGVQ